MADVTIAGLSALSGAIAATDLFELERPAGGDAGTYKVTGADLQTLTIAALTAEAITTALGGDPLLKSGGVMAGAISGGPGTVTANTPVLNLSETWNNAGVTFTGLKLDITDTASAAGSVLLDLRVNSGSGAMLFKSGELRTLSSATHGLKLYPNYALLGNATWGLEKAGLSDVSLFINTTGFAVVPQLMLYSGLKWNTQDLFLIRDAAGVFAQRNSTNPQRFNLYGTYTDASNYRRGFITDSLTGGLTIGSEGLGTGATGNSITFATDGTNRLQISSTGLVQFGGTTASFPSLKRNATGLDVRLADDSDYAPLRANFHGDSVAASLAGKDLDLGEITLSSFAGLPASYGVAASDETTAITTGTGKVTFRMPHAMTLTSVRASLTTAQTSGSTFTIDVKKAGVSIFSTLLTIDNGEETSVSAATAAVLSTTSLASDDKITVDVTQVGDGTAKGLKVVLIGTYA